ncbi:uncharacterized protein LOC143622596 [Bidens hawaiensis]|uniref:uncharacterized protein LOC143622596 n=1 Tax=Bidens hawaiensis TaxID=980011 RepID=UPI00404AAF36
MHLLCFVYTTLFLNHLYNILVLGNDEPMENEKVHPTDEVAATKKKKKKVIAVSDDCAVKDQPEVTDKKKKKSGKNSGQLSTDTIVNEPEMQPKKKKAKHDLGSSTDDAVNDSKIDNLTKKIKDKKKKNIEKVKLEACTTSEDEIVTEVAQKYKKKKKKLSTDESLNVQPDVTEEEEKSSKKRKRSFSDEIEKKPETFKGKKSGKEEINDLETSNEPFDGESNGKVKTDGVKSKKKQSNATVEPKTVSVFQRVKIDEVEFAHDKLQDNSYWAKGGAEIGYGAKAQEVLGQVRGRDFRHEKTKKKRGSYRGGLIDQQSHSIKFDYSDEE